MEKPTFFISETCTRQPINYLPKEKHQKDLKEKVIEVLLAPLKFILGLIQCIVVLFLLFCGLFLKGGPKELFIGEGIFGARAATPYKFNKMIDAAGTETPTTTNVSSTTLFSSDNNQLKAVTIINSRIDKFVKTPGANPFHFTKTESTTDPSRATGKWIVFIPGMHSSTESHHSVMWDLYRATDVEGVICCNPPGIGDSQGVTRTPEDFFEASSAAIRYIQEKHNKDHPETPLEITLWGHSLGGTSAMHNANLEEFKEINIRVVLDRTFTKYDKAIRYSSLIFTPCVQLLRSYIRKHFPLNLKEKVRETNRQIVVIASEKDEVIHVDSASAITIESENIRGRFLTSFKKETGSGEICEANKRSASLTPEHSFRHTLETIRTIWNDFVTN